MNRPIRAGDVYWISRSASVQFATRPILFRVIREHPWDTYDGWVWLDGYELDAGYDAVTRRSIFVMRAGLCPPHVRPASLVLAGAGARDRRWQRNR